MNDVVRGKENLHLKCNYKRKDKYNETKKIFGIAGIT